MDQEDKIKKVEKIIMAYEDQLSDGYKYYADSVEMAVRDMAKDIVLTISEALE